MLLFVFTLAQAQTADDKAKAYYQEAQKAFESKNYKQTIDYCKQVTDLLKNTNARIELLRIKSYYELSEYDKVKEAIKALANLQASTELKNEALEYLVKVEKIEKEAEDKRLSEQRKLEQERIAKVQRLAEERVRKEEIEAKSYANAMSGNVSSIRQFLKDYPNHEGKQIVMDLLDTKEEQAYNNVLVKNEIGVYKNYLIEFYDSKHTTEITEHLKITQEVEAYEEVVRNKSVAECEAYFNNYSNGANKTEVLTIYEEALIFEGQKAMNEKNYVLAETLYNKYKVKFPNGNDVKLAETNYKEAKRKVEKQEKTALRNDKTYFMLQYTTNESAGIEIGKLNKSYKLSVYGAINYGFKFPIEENEVIELESVDDYNGDGKLKAGLVSASFGFNMKITYPLWVYAGAGVKYQVFVDGSSTSYKVKGEDEWQFFPEFGLKTKLGKVISLKAGVQLYKNKPAFQFGIGF